MLVLCGTAGIFLEMVRKSKSCRVQKLYIKCNFLECLICFSKFPTVSVVMAYNSFSYSIQTPRVETYSLGETDVGGVV